MIIIYLLLGSEGYSKSQDILTTVETLFIVKYRINIGVK